MSEEVPLPPYARVNMLTRVALNMGLFLVIIVIVADYLHLSAATQTTLGIILGRVWGYIDQIYAFEFSTTRSSRVKDDTIKRLSEPTVNGIQTINTPEVDIRADTATVNKQ